MKYLIIILLSLFTFNTVASDNYTRDIKNLIRLQEITQNGVGFYRIINKSKYYLRCSTFIIDNNGNRKTFDRFIVYANQVSGWAPWPALSYRWECR